MTNFTDFYPNLAGVITKKDVSKLPTGYGAEYVNWALTLDLLRKNAPGWLPEMVLASDGGLLHKAPIGAYLLIRFVHMDGRTTPPVPQAVMDNCNNAVIYEKITARDITDTQRRGICMAAAFTFGLAYELWAKLPVESGYGNHYEPKTKKAEPAEPPQVKTQPPVSKPLTPLPPIAPPVQTFVPPYESWKEINERTNEAIKELGWSQSEAQHFLLENYGKKSRQLLTQDEFEDFDLQLALFVQQQDEDLGVPASMVGNKEEMALFTA